MNELTATEHSRLIELEGIVKQGLETFIDVGFALMEIRDSRLYRSDYSTFEAYCQNRWGMTRQHANRTIKAAETALFLEPIGSKPENEAQLRPLTNLEPEEQREVWQTAVATAPNGKVTAAHVEQTKREYLTPLRSADGEDSNPIPYKPDDWRPPVSKPHVANNSGNNEWYTPAEYIEAARLVLGNIDLDPASSTLANEVVRADFFYTAETDGLTAEWWGNVWMNPPYGSDLISRFCEKLITDYISGEVEQAIVLVNNATETGWFQLLASYADCICFPKSRIKYWGENGQANSPLQGQAFLYFGDNSKKFISTFGTFGFLVALAYEEAPSEILIQETV